MTDRIVTGQELVAHVFALREGPDAESSVKAVLSMWERCRDLLGAVDPLAGLPTDLGAVPLTARPGRSTPVAGAQRPDRLVQAVARCDGDVLSLTLLLAEGLAPSWKELRDLLDPVLGDDSGLLGVCVLHLGKHPAAEAVHDLGEIAARSFPSLVHPSAWRFEGVRAGAGLALWEPAPDDTSVRREFVLLAEPTPAGDRALTTWSLTRSGGAEIPPFARYLLHVAKIRYQLLVLSGFPQAERLRRLSEAGPDAARSIQATARRLLTMRQAVEVSWRNAVTAVSSTGWTPAFDDAGPFGRDHDLVTWLVEQLRLDVARWEATGADSLEASGSVGLPATVGGRPLRLLAIADEWLPARGGLSQLNRSLCAALASVGAQVSCLVPEATAAELADAAALRVRLEVSSVLRARLDGAAPTGEPLLRATDPPDVVVGHSRFTGPVARDLIARHHPGAVRVHVVHMVADDLEGGKQGGDPSRTAEDRGDREIELGSDAQVVVSVGPRLHGWSVREMPPEQDGGPIRYRLDPGFDHPPSGERTPPAGRPKIMIMGRTQDAHNKGMDLACRAVARAAWLSCHRSRWDLLVRGVPAGEAAELTRRLNEWTADARSVHVIPPRYYTTDSQAVRRDLLTSSLLPMASRSEGYGLVGHEAVIAGTPLLVSSRSGLGMLLHDLLPPELRDLVVVPVEGDDEADVQRWGHYAATVLENRPAAFAIAAQTRRVMARERTWEGAAIGLLDLLKPLVSR